MTKEIHCENTCEIVCPYCGFEHDDSDAMVDDDYHATQKIKCEQCDKKFIVEIRRTTRYYSAKADCLNGGEHDWSEWRKAIPSLLLREERQCRGCSIREQRDVE